MISTQRGKLLFAGFLQYKKVNKENSKYLQIYEILKTEKHDKLIISVILEFPECLKVYDQLSHL